MKGEVLLAYFAGLIDGEAYIGAKRRMPTKANHMRSPKYSVAFFKQLKRISPRSGQPGQWGSR